MKEQQMFRGKKMNCIDTEKSILRFIENKMNYQETEEFIEHISSCDSCMEELNIQFLIEVGMKRLEEGSNFNLNKELAEKIRNESIKARRVKILTRINYLVKFLIIIGVLAFAIYWLII